MSGFLRRVQQRFPGQTLAPRKRVCCLISAPGAGHVVLISVSAQSGLSGAAHVGKGGDTAEVNVSVHRRTHSRSGGACMRVSSWTSEVPQPRAQGLRVALGTAQHWRLDGDGHSPGGQRGAGTRPPFGGGSRSETEAQPRPPEFPFSYNYFSFFPELSFTGRGRTAQPRTRQPSAVHLMICPHPLTHS